MRTLNRQFKRACRVTVGLPGQEGRSWDGLRVTFSIKKTTRSRPNKATLTLTNLSAASRALLEREGTVVLLEAGYAGDAPQLFAGDVDTVEHEHDGTEWTSKIEARDGGFAWRSEADEVWDGPLDSSALLRRIADKMGLKDARIAPDLPTADYPGGFCVGAELREGLDAITGELGASWSILDGELVVTPRGAPIRQEIFLLSRRTGLVGTPEKTKKGKGIKARALLNGRLQPGDLVQLEGEHLAGVYLIRTVEHSGESTGGDWYSDLELGEPA